MPEMPLIVNSLNPDCFRLGWFSGNGHTARVNGLSDDANGKGRCPDGMID
jgi:hypothetical protein